MSDPGDQRELRLTGDEPSVVREALTLCLNDAGIPNGHPGLEAFGQLLDRWNLAIDEGSGSWIIRDPTDDAYSMCAVTVSLQESRLLAIACGAYSVYVYIITAGDTAEDQERLHRAQVATQLLASLWSPG
jgi:hypothetical protein